MGCPAGVCAILQYNDGLSGAKYKVILFCCVKITFWLVVFQVLT